MPLLTFLQIALIREKEKVHKSSENLSKNYSFTLFSLSPGSVDKDAFFLRGCVHASNAISSIAAAANTCDEQRQN